LYTYALGLLPLIALGVEALLFALVFFLLAGARSALRPGSQGAQEHQSGKP
jgi:hypothetical protein